MNSQKEVGHTPGPWKISKAFGNFTICESAEVNLVNSGKWNPEVCTGIVSFADARLIAAAPDLLKAAKGCLFLLDKKYPPSNNICIAAENLRAAIAKAEGRKNGGCRACDVGQGEP